MRRGIGIAVACVAFSGCFAWVPTELDGLGAGDRIQVHLTRAALAEQVLASPDSAAPELEPVLNGTLSRRTGESLLVRVPVVPLGQQVPGGPSFGRDVLVPTADVARVERRRVDRVRTALLGAAVAGVGAVLLYVIMDEAGGEGIPMPPGGNNVVIPVP